MQKPYAKNSCSDCFSFYTVRYQLPIHVSTNSAGKTIAHYRKEIHKKNRGSSSRASNDPASQQLCFHRKESVVPITDVDNESLPALVAAAQLGDREAWDRIALTVTPGLYATAMARVHDVSKAQDVVQAVLLRAFRKLTQLRDPQSLRGWLRKMANRIAIDQNKGPLLLPLEMDSSEANCGPLESGSRLTPLDQLILKEDQAFVYCALAQLKTIYGETLWRFYIGGQIISVIALEMDTNEATVRRRLHYGRKKLGVVLVNLGYDWGLCA